jgi:hypothetical protein
VHLDNFVIAERVDPLGLLTHLRLQFGANYLRVGRFRLFIESHSPPTISKFSRASIKTKTFSAPHSSHPCCAPSPQKIFGFRGYFGGVRVEALNVLNRQNPNAVANNVDAPNFGAFSGGQALAFTLRVRFIASK